MQSNSRYAGTSDGSCSIFLSSSGVCEGDGNKSTNDTVLNTEPQVFSQAFLNGTCNTGMASYRSTESCSFSLSDFSEISKGKACMRDYGTGGNAFTEDDLNLMLGLGSSSFKRGNHSGSEHSLAQEVTGKESTSDYLTSSRGLVSGVLSIPGASLDLGREVNPDDSHESGEDNRALFRHYSQQSSSWNPGYGDIAGKGSRVLLSISRKNTGRMDLQVGLSTCSSLIMLDGLSGMPSSSPGGYTQEWGISDVLAAERNPLIDEGSTSGRWIKSAGYSTAVSPCLDVRVNQSGTSSRAILSLEDSTEMDLFMRRKAPMVSDLAFESFTRFSEHGLKNIPAVACAGSLVSNSERIFKMCSVKGCPKRARGASGLCIAHGGGRRCLRTHCNKGAEGCTVYCKSHGGGRRCEILGCIRSAEGRTNFCIGHGGGRRCDHDGCNKAARGKSGFCIRHGGGKRCQKEGCTKSAEGFSGLCISHGGGRRCQYPDCGKGSQGSTIFCKAHGGGRRCAFEGCTKGAEGSTSFCKGHGGGKRCMFGGGTCTKSVHGATLFCVAHGGGKRCASEGCSKSARGRTDYCVRHGGGKRCKFKDCSKSAQGSTEFCKAHGGGKNCWRCQEISTYSGNILLDNAENNFTGLCNRFARGRMAFCPSHSALVQECKGMSGSSSYSTIADLIPEPVPMLIPNVPSNQPLSDVSKHSCHFGPIIDYDHQPSSDISEAQLFQYASLAHVGPQPGFVLPQSSQVESWSAVNMNDSSTAKSTFLDVQHSCDVPGESDRLQERVSSFFFSELMFPLSLQKGDLPLQEKMRCVVHADSKFASVDISNSPFPEERVHGGGLMALLAKEAARHVETQ